MSLSRIACGVLFLSGILLVLCPLLVAQSINVTVFPVPGSNVNGAYPISIASGSDGALWFTEYLQGKIGRVTTTGNVTEYPVPFYTGGASIPPGAGSAPEDITLGPDGALWFTDVGTGPQFGTIRRVSTSGTITPYLVFNQTLGITTGPDGALWFTTVEDSIGRITTSGVVSKFPIPGLSNPQIDGVPNRITAGPDGALWFTLSPNGSYGGVLGGGNSIGRITTAGVVTLFPIPTPTSQPNRITKGPDGALWFTELNSGKIGRITTAGVITEYLGSPHAPNAITTGPDGALWFTDNGRIGRITTGGVITEYSESAGLCSNCGSGITTGPDGALWVVGGAGSVARVALSNRSGVLSHIAAGGAWATVITLVNTASAAVPVTVAFHNDDGSALSLPVSTTNQGATQTATTSSVTATINPNSTLLVTTGQSAATVVGWADVTSTGPLGGYAIFRQTPQTGSPSEGTVPLQSQFPSTVTLSYDNTAGFVMGVALANLASSSSNITATMWDDSGNLLGTQIITIAGNGHTSFVLPNQLSLTTGRRGIVQFQSAATGGLAGLGLRFSPFGTFTSVPTM